jgi:hypothetical protein
MNKISDGCRQFSKRWGCVSTWQGCVDAFTHFRLKLAPPPNLHASSHFFCAPPRVLSGSSLHSRVTLDSLGFEIIWRKSRVTMTQTLMLPSLFQSVLRPYFGVSVDADGYEQIDLPAMQWYVVPVAIAFYYISLYLIWPQKNAKVIKLKSTGKALVLLHNLLLMVYSMLVLYETLPLLVNCYFEHGSLYQAVSLLTSFLCRFADVYV